MGFRETIRSKRGEIIAISKHYGAGNVRLFGSVARGVENKDSDVDFLVELEKGRSLFDLGGLAFDLQELLGRRVDVVTEKGLHWYIKDRILAEAEPI
ncbi:MAG: nucleotidyltransferase family protein [Proteobacteria bacterium]|nr:nucleotidyltransferase family protein [Pseudomonadota bacterium]MBU1736652.1 nucleotidyltransferase family protein [Pseudomonadota bacterium]